MWQSYVLHFLDNIQWLEFSTDMVILNFWLFKTYISWNFQRMWQSYVFDLLEMQWLELPTEVAILYIWLWDKILKGRGLSGLDMWHPCLEWGLISKNSLHTESIWIHWLKLALNVKNQDNECLSLGFFTNIGIWYRYKPGQQNRQEILRHMLLSPTLKTKQDWMQEDDHGWWNKLHETLQYGQHWSQIIGRP